MVEVSQMISRREQLETDSVACQTGESSRRCFQEENERAYATDTLTVPSHA